MICFCLSFAAVFCVSFYTYGAVRSFMKDMEYHITQRLIEVGKRGAALVSAEELEQYRRREDMQKPSYQALRTRLFAFSQETGVLYIYIMRRQGDRLQYIVDNDFNEKTRVGLDTPLVDLAAAPWTLPAWEQGAPAASPFGIYDPSWKNIVSGYSPLFDRQGRVAALVGVDIQDTTIIRTWSLVNILMLVQVLSMAAVFAGGIIGLARFQREAIHAREASMAKSRFLSQISHEIRTPMNAIIGMGELALRSDTVPKMVEYVGGIKQAGHNLLSLINDILDFAKIETGSLQISPVPYSLASLLNDVINVARFRLTDKPILFIANVSAGLPDRLLGDEVRIRQILLNLLSNAAKYTQRGFIQLRITDLQAAQDPKGAQHDGGAGEAPGELLLGMEVSDTGIGIKKEDMSHLFNDFVRLDLTRNKSIEGTGLGLAITRSLCRCMGGDIQVASVYGKGSMFKALVPQGVIQEEPLAAVKHPASKTILFYDHRPGYVESILETLIDLGAPVTLSPDTNEFLDKLSYGAYTFAFISERILERSRLLIRERSLKTVLVLLADQKKLSSPEQVLVIPMPAYAVSIANVLNGNAMVQRREDTDIGFTAPEARILLVDDIPTNLKVAEGLLEPFTVQVDACLNGVEAISLVKRREYDLIFMDHMMPEMDGIETVAAIREWEKERHAQKGLKGGTMPIIALTANAVSGMREMFLENGFNDYLAKPIEVIKLNEIMKRWIPQEKQLPLRKEAAAHEDHTDGLESFEAEGIDLIAGKQRYQEGAYREVLRSYYLHTPALLEKLRSLAKETPFSPETLGEYTTLVHGVKGATYGICADRVAKQAEALEHAARRGDLDFIETVNNSFFENVETLLKNLGGLLEQITPGDEEKPQAAAPDPGLLQKLAEACKHYKASTMEELLKELEKYTYASGGELVSWLREQADNLEYDAIRDRLTHTAANG
ncbi:MAG: response regulator [Treponema sp.]|nr:response regulator [Treponema sp.]